MRLQCSYCRSFFGETEPLDDDAVTHGMCDECFEHFDAQWAGQNLESFLDKFEFPVLAVGPDSRIVAVNERAATFVRRPRRSVRGFLGGEALECANARLPEGCGETVHCQRCSIRRAVMDTRLSGHAHHRVETSFDRVDGHRRFWISTELLVPPGGGDTVVVLTVEESLADGS